MPLEPPGLPHAPLESSALALNGFELQVDRFRGGDRSHVLLLHGLGGNAVTWHGVAPLLAAELGAQVLTLDLPGFGRSRTGGRRVDFRTLSLVVQHVLQSEAPSGTRWVLAGNSLGGALALDVACRAPELVAAVSLAALALPLAWGRNLRGLAALSSWLPAALPWIGRRLVSRYMIKTGVPGVVDEPIRALFGDPQRLDAGLRERLLDVSQYRLSWAREAACAYEQVTRSLGVELLRATGVERTIREVRCPVQALHGSRDPIFPAAAWLELEQRRPDWQHVTLPDIGHVPQLEAPREVAVHLLDWLRALGA
jgi:pimeloyl-ACP methyl ester carboxylesterase